MGEAGMQVRVVVVDDDEDIRHLVSITLGLDGRFDVVATATTAGDAVREVVRLRPHAVLLDLTLPDVADGDGLRVVRDLRRLAPDSAVVVFSGRADEDIEERVLAAGGCALVAKGGSGQAFVDALLRGAGGAVAVGSGDTIADGAAVAVRSTFSGAWQEGFVVSRADPGWYWLQRGDGSVLAAPVDAARVRPSPQTR